MNANPFSTRLSPNIPYISWKKRQIKLTSVQNKYSPSSSNSYEAAHAYIDWIIQKDK